MINNFENFLNYLYDNGYFIDENYVYTQEHIRMYTIGQAFDIYLGI